MDAGRVFEQYILKGAVAVASISLGINSFLVKDKMVEISADIKSMTAAIRALEVDRAVTAQQVTAFALRIERNDTRLSRVEAAISSIAGRLSITLPEK